MLLAIDIGNSNIVIGIYKNAQWIENWRIVTNEDMPQSAYEMKVRQNMLEAGLSFADFGGVVISSVVPNLTIRISDMVSDLTGHIPYQINPMNMGNVAMKIHNPVEIGSDLVANAVAAFNLFKSDCLVVDFGTALTFTSVSKAESIVGVSIVPGIKTAIKALTQNTAKLPSIDLALPESVLGQDTVHAIRSGILFGYVGLVKEMIARNRTEISDNLKVVATGGLSHVLHPLKDQFDIVDLNLTLDGLRLIYEKNMPQAQPHYDDPLSKG